MCKLSVITINRNNRHGLEATLASLNIQGSSDFEWIVIDGASSDGSMETIETPPGFLKESVSEPDSGIYQAMNKGIMRATGEYVLFLNSGDCLVSSDTVKKLVRSMESSADIYYANPIIKTKTSQYAQIYREPLDLDFFLSGTLNHQNVVCRRELFVAQGLFREDFRVSSDWFFLIKCFLEQEPRFELLKFPICIYNDMGFSSSSEGRRIDREERRQAISELFEDLAPQLLELSDYRDSIYGNIIRLYGETGLLRLILRTYRYFVRRLFLIRDCLNAPKRKTGA